MLRADTCIIIPAYNPPMLLTALVDELLGLGFTVLVVDDGSDPTREQPFSALPDGVLLIHLPKNSGKGCALKAGFALLLESRPTIARAVTVDADGKHRPADILALDDRLRAEPCDLALGCRRFDTEIPRIIRVGNAITRWVFRTKTGLRLPDTQTGLRAFPRARFEALAAIRGRRYEYETNVLLTAAEEHWTIQTVPIRVDYRGRRALDHFHPVRDSILIYSQLLKFTLSSFLAFLVDYGVLLGLTPLVKFGLPSLELLVCVTVARIVSSAVNYVVNRRLVFKSDGSVGRGIAAFLIMSLILLAGSYGLLDLVNLRLGVALWIAKPAVDMILFICNYFIQTKLIFRKKKTPPNTKNEASGGSSPPKPSERL